MVNKTNFETINIDDFNHDPINQAKVQSYPPELVGRFNSFIVTAFDDSMTVEMQIRTMIKWVKENIDVTMSALDNMEAFKQDSMAFQNHVKNTLVNLINQFTDKFDDNLQFEMQEILKQWDKEGYLQSLINDYTNERIDTLGQRMDDTTTQLAQIEQNKISKGEVTIYDIDKNAGKFDESYLSEGLISQIAGTTPISPIPADYSITKNKLAFNVLEVVRSKNLYNKDTVTRGRYISFDGTLVINGKYNISDYIEIEPNTEYSFNNNYFTLAYYDSDKQFISYYAYVGRQITTPVDAKYMRFTTTVELTNVFQLEKGRESTNYADYYNLPSSSINKVDIEHLSFSEPSKNLFNKKTVTTNRFITDTGIISSGIGFNVTDFIQVEQKTYALNKLSFGKISCFDSSKNFIASVDLVNGTFKPVENTEFIRFTVHNDNLDSTQLEEGMFSTSYKDYGMYIPADKIIGLDNLNDGGVKEVKRITVGKNNSDFTSINDALNSIMDASENNRYEILVKNGTYNETFRTKHYVDIIGQDKYKTIIDYTGELETWVDTSTVFAESNMTLSNLTLIGTDTKYPLHIDKSTGAWDMMIKNVRCIHRGSLTGEGMAGTPVGIGLYQYQNLTMIDCDFIYDDVKGVQAFGASGVYFHNASDATGTGYRKLVVERCRIKGVTYGYRPNAVNGTTAEQRNDAYIVNNDITATHKEYYFAEEETDESWNIFAIGNKYTQG